MGQIIESELRKWWDVERVDEYGNPMLTEIRIIGNKQTFSGYFLDVDTLLDAIKSYVNYNIYYTINCVKDGCYDREQKNKIIAKPKNTTTDSEIEGRTMILIDLDPKRVVNTNSTDEELKLSEQKANDIYSFLKREGFNDPLIVHSGNGVHLKYKCKLSTSAENNQLVKDFLSALSMMFSDENVEVDTVVYNLGRIAKLPSTYSRKGTKDSAKRPQRLCKYVKVPSIWKSNDIEYIKKVANMLPKPEKPDRFNNYQTSKFNLQDFIREHNIKISKTTQSSTGTKYVLEECPFDSSHKAPDSAIFELASGGFGFKCLHNSCSHYGFREFRAHFDPNAYSYNPTTYQGYSNPNNNKNQSSVKEDIVETKDKGKVWLKMSDVEIEEIDPLNYIPSGVEQIDSKIIGFKRGHVSVWSGLRGSAKTTMFNVLILNAAQMGYKTALWTGELDSGEVKTWLYLQASGKNHNRPSKFNNFYYTPKNIIPQINKWIDKYFYLFNNEYGDNYIQVEDQIRKLHKEQKVDSVILDNLMTLDIDNIEGGVNEKQKNFMKMLTKLAKELKIHVHVACHPNKSMGFLRPNSISGSGHIPDLAQNVFILHRKGLDFSRDAQDFLDTSTIQDIELSRATNLCEICKCRAKGSAVGTFIKMHFEMESNRLKNEISEHIVYGWEEQPVEQKISFDDDPLGFGYSDFGNETLRECPF